MLTYRSMAPKDSGESRVIILGFSWTFTVKHKKLPDSMEDCNQLWMVAAGVQPDALTWSVIIGGYSSGAEKERALERMVAAGVG